METRQRLLENAERLFAEQGVAATRTVDIAEAAGVAVGTLYLHFGDKRGLLRAILFAGLENLLAPLRELAENLPGDLEQAVRRHSEIIVAFAEERPRFCHVFFDPETRLTDVWTEALDYLVQMQEQRLREGMERGMVPREVDTVVAAQAIVGMLLHVLQWWVHHPEAASRETVLDTLTRLRVSGLS